MAQREPSHTVGGDVNWYSHYGKQYGSFIKTKIALSYDPAIPLLGTYTEKGKSLIQKDAPPYSINALSTIPETWKQSVYPSTHGWIKRLWCVTTMEYCSVMSNSFQLYGL